MKNKKKDTQNVKHTKLYAKAVSGKYEYNNMDNVEFYVGTQNNAECWHNRVIQRGTSR